VFIRSGELRFKTFSSGWLPGRAKTLDDLDSGCYAWCQSPCYGVVTPKIRGPSGVSLLLLETDAFLSNESVTGVRVGARLLCSPLLVQGG